MALHLDYACIFTHSDAEYVEMDKLTRKTGRVADETAKGNVYEIPALDTAAGKLFFLKIRKPYATHPDLGDADFGLKDYAAVKKQYLGQPGFSLMIRPGFEMIELVEPGGDIRVYFSNPPFNRTLHLTENMSG